MSERRYAWSLVFVQFLCIAAVLGTGPALARGPGFLALQAGGLIFGIWALVVMGPETFSVAPIPRPNSRLVERGPYRWVRHPMYSAVLLFTLAPAASGPGPLRLVLWLLLLITLVAKLRFEERLLVARVPGYASYRSRTARLVPLLY